jgi:hypothetical protein
VGLYLAVDECTCFPLNLVFLYCVAKVMTPGLTINNYTSWRVGQILFQRESSPWILWKIWFVSGMDWIRFSRVSGLIISRQASTVALSSEDSWAMVLKFPLKGFWWMTGQVSLGSWVMCSRTEKICFRAIHEFLWLCELLPILLQYQIQHV